jgi:pyruvate dehydrogenase E1 component alpha subunit
VNEGLFYEAANMASLWQLPVVYIMENNSYGEYTPPSKAMAGSGPARAEAMGIPSRSVDGNDVLAVYRAAVWATERARSDLGPSFVECKTYRWRGHHMGDQGDTYGYRNQEEIESWMTRCPIKHFRGYLLEKDLVEEDALNEIDQQVEQLIEQAVEFAKQAPYPDPSEVFDHVYA